MDKLPYQFHDDRREIRFDRFDLPAPWIHYLSNEPVQKKAQIAFCTLLARQ